MDNENEDAPKVIKAPYKSKRFFVSSLNTYLGYQLVEMLRNDKEHPEDPNLIVGTKINNSQMPISDGVRKIIDGLKLQYLEKVILDSDVIIYDITTCDHAEAEFVIKTLKLGDYKDEKIIILISSVMVWSATSPKEKKAGDEDEDPMPPDSEEEQQQQEQQKNENENEDEEVVKKEYVRFIESDYPRRRPLPQYDGLRSLESMCLALNKINLKPFILCSGILYGMGEECLYNHFKNSWLQRTIHYFGKGKNRIPMIHVKDLALFAAKVVEKQPNSKYIFAIDHNPNPQQKKIIETISKGIGNGKIESIEGENDILTLDLRMKPSTVFDQFLEEAANMDDGQEGEVVDKFTFNWWCKEGIRVNIAKIREEFLEVHKLKAIKIMIIGPPAVGKSNISQQLNKYFKIPHIKIKDVIEEYLNQTNEEAENMKSAIQDAKSTLVEEAQQQYEIAKRKRKQLGQPYVAFDESKIEAKLTDEQLVQVYKWRLMQNDCQNRGFILDAFPKTYQQCKALFYNIDGEGDEQKIILNKLILPDHVIQLIGSDEEIVQRIMNLKENLYEEEVLYRRLKRYRQLNQQKGYTILVDFFKELKIDINEIDVFNKSTDILASSRSFIERYGKYNNYDTQEIEQELKRLQERELQIELAQKKQKQLEEKRDQQEDYLWKIQEEEYKIKQQNSVNYERELLDSKSLPLRQYLNDNVVPFITEGLFEIVRSNNDVNPIDFLAEFLFKKSQQVKYPDPLKYFQKQQE